MENQVYCYTDEFQERLLLHRISLKKESVKKEALLILADIRNRNRQEGKKKESIPFRKLVFSVKEGTDGYFFDAFLEQSEVKRRFENPFKKALVIRKNRLSKGFNGEEKLLALSKEGLLSFYKAKRKDPMVLLSRSLSLPLNGIVPDLGVRNEVTLARVKDAYQAVSSSVSGRDIYLGKQVKGDPFYGQSSLSSSIVEPCAPLFPRDRERKIDSLDYDLFSYVLERKEVKNEKERKERETALLRLSSALEDTLKKGLGSKIVVEGKELTPKYVLLSFRCEAKKRDRFKERIREAFEKKDYSLSSYFLPSFNKIRTRQVLFNEDSSLILGRISENALYSLTSSDEDYFSAVTRKEEDVRKSLEGLKPLYRYSFLSKEEK